MSLQDTVRSALSAIATALPELAVQVRYAGTDAAMAGTIASAISAGVERARVVTEQGLVGGMSGSVRYNSSLEPAAWGVPVSGQDAAIDGQPVEVLLYGDTAWTRCRVTGRKVVAGMVRLNLAAEFEQ